MASELSLFLLQARPVFDGSKVFLPRDILSLTFDVISGDADAWQLLQIVGPAQEAFVAQPSCFACGTTTHAFDAAIVVVSPHLADRNPHISFGICPSCGKTTMQVMAAAMAALQQLWPFNREANANSGWGLAVALPSGAAA